MVRGFESYILKNLTKTGTTVESMKVAEFLSQTFGAPPLAEQHRIVARVDELMGLLDRLEAARATRDEVRRAARDAALADLRDAPDPEAVEAAWTRIARHMDDLFTEPEDVAPLRQAVLQLAVRGRLVPQDPTDSPPTIGSSRKDIPSRWTLTTVGDLGADGYVSVADGPFGSKLKKAHYVNAPGYRVVRLGNIGIGHFKDEDKAYVSAEYFQELESYHLTPRDVLVASLGDPPGRACVVPPSVLPALNKADCFRIRPSEQVSPDYLTVALNSPTGAGRSIDLKRGDTRGRINLTHLRTAPIALPPLAEQHRIVAKVDALMALCDDLEARLTTARDLQGQFAAAAAVHHLDV